MQWFHRILLVALVGLLAANTAHARSLKQLTGTPTATSGDACFAPFKAWLDATKTCTGSQQECCAGLLALGASCWEQILNSGTNEQTNNAVITLYQGCGLSVTPVTAPAPAPSNDAAPPLDEQRCVDSFNAALNTNCTTSTGFVACCNSLSALGDQCIAFVDAAMAANASYAQLHSNFLGQLDSCRIPLPNSNATAAPPPAAASPAPPSGTNNGVCFNGFLNALDTSCGPAGTQIDCCFDLEALGESCLEDVANVVSANQTIFDTYAQLLGSCGWSITTKAQLGQLAGALADSGNPDVAHLSGSLRAGLAKPGCALCGASGQVAAPVTRRSALAVKQRQFSGKAVGPALLNKLSASLH